MDNKIKPVELKNGLRYIHIPNNRIKTFSLVIAIKVGSRDEDLKDIGSSHLLEHMLFKGTRKHPTFEKIQELLDSYGTYNAYTAKNCTCFYIKAPSSKFRECISLFFNMMFHSLISKSAMEMEKNVVIEELKRMKDDHQKFTIHEIMKKIFKNHPLEKSVIGTEESIKNFDRDLVYKYYKHHYNPNNMVVSICGNIGKYGSKLKKMLELFTSKKYINNDSTFRNPVQKVPFCNQSHPNLIVKTHDGNQCALTIGFPCVNMYQKQVYALKIINIILGGGMSSRLFKEVRTKAGLAYNIFSGEELYQDAGFIYLNAGIEKNSLFKNKNINKKPGALYIILKEFEKIANKGITQKELDFAKEKIENDIALMYEGTDDVALYYAEQILFDYPNILSFDDYLNNIKSLRLDYVNKVIKETFDFKKLNISIIGNYEHKEVLDYLLKTFLKK